MRENYYAQKLDSGFIFVSGLASIIAEARSFNNGSP
jgi:hypothetical protein